LSAAKPIAISKKLSVVMPAQAGIQYSVRQMAEPTPRSIANGGGYWIPACAGMTTERSVIGFSALSTGRAERSEPSVKSRKKLFARERIAARERGAGLIHIGLRPGEIVGVNGLGVVHDPPAQVQ
jgi:hypothetical protein